MRKTIYCVILTLTVLMLLSACGGGGDDPSSTIAGGEVVGDADRGERLYKKNVIGAANAPGCTGCHSLEPGVQFVGPSHAGVATRATAAVQGKSAEAFMKESIIDPNAAAPEGFVTGLMYEHYATDLSQQEIADLVAFLLTLK